MVLPKISDSLNMKTDRLRLRKCNPTDSDLFYAMNSDPEVMRYFPSPLSRAESDEFLSAVIERHNEHGWGFWAVELLTSSEFIGFVGLNRPKINLPFNPCVEIGWRLMKECWGNGYATEAARCCLAYAFNQLHLDEVVSFTAVVNTPSQAVMKKIGMYNSEEDFEHPSLLDGCELKRHVLYKIDKQQWNRL